MTEKMSRVLVIGSGGAGKTTFARALADRTGLPLVHLDAEHWRPGWVAPPRPEWDATVDRLIARPEWIMDGNYGGTLPRRLEACDTVIFLDRGRLTCLWRVFRRRVAYRGSTRPDLPEGCPEQLTLDFLRWIWRYPKRRRGAILERLSGLRPDQPAVVLRSEAEIERFLWALEGSPPERGSSTTVGDLRVGAREATRDPLRSSGP